MLKLRDKSLNRYLRGKKAQKEGKGFEHTFLLNARRSGFTVLQIPTGCKNIGRGRIVKVKTPFDFILIKNGKTIFIDTKSIDDKTYSHSRLTRHQLIALDDCFRAGCLSGYVINFRSIDKTYFAPIKHLWNLTPNQSLRPENLIFLGSSTQFDLNLINGKIDPNDCPSSPWPFSV